MPPAQTIKINLLPKDPFQSSTLGKILLWALSVGRYIVIFTELIVILSFLSRFKLDRDLTDLNSAIEKEKAIVLSYGDLENRVNAIHDKVTFLEQVEASQNSNQVVDTITSLLPPDIRLEQLSVTDERVNFTALSLSLQSLDQLIANINANPQFTDVQLNTVESESDSTAISFGVSAGINQVAE